MIDFDREEGRRSDLDPGERHAHILDLLSRQGTATLHELQAVSRASVATLRRDLEALEKEGSITRFRGGAKLVSRPSSLDETFALRRRRNASAKGSIAVAAAELVPSGASLFINDGTTTLAFAEELVREKKELWVATSALNIAERLAAAGSFDVVVLGGSVRGTSFGTVGPLATAALEQLSADFAFLSCDGYDAIGGVHANNLLDAEIARAMVRSARRTVLLADATKHGNTARARVVSWDDVDELVTDAIVPDLSSHLRATGTTVTLAPPL